VTTDGAQHNNAPSAQPAASPITPERPRPPPACTYTRRRDPASGSHGSPAPARH